MSAQKRASVEAIAKRFVLFSGGTASNLLARTLEASGAEVTNVITVFDNGGSTGALRRVRPIPAMGDIRNRLVALAPADGPEQAATKRLFEWRLSDRKSENQLQLELKAFAD